MLRAPRPSPALRLLALAPALALLACGGGAATSTGSTSSGSGGMDAGPSFPAPICHSVDTTWKPGTTAFKESTSAWGLDTAGVKGTRISAVDFDNDGWPDLVVRLGGPGADDFSPGGVRQTWLLRNTGHGTFEDVTEKSGIRQKRTDTTPNTGRPGEVWAFADVDNDGDLDVFTGHTLDPMKPGVETSELMLNNGDGTFSLGPANSPVSPKPPNFDAVAGATFTDFDRDGNVDLWVVENTVNGSPKQDRLYKGDGHGGFVDVTYDMGLRTKPWGSNPDPLNQALGHSDGWAANACDLNGDGSPELLASSYGRAPNQLWQSKGKDGGFQFINQSIASGYASDGNQDWSDNESARCWCTLHPTDTGCAGVPAPMYIQCMTDADAFRWNNATDQNPYRLGGNSGTTNCADVDNDGHLDLVTSEIAHWDVGKNSDRAELLVNTGEADAKFTRPGNDATGLARTYKDLGWNEGIMTGAVFDFDNDRWPDIYFGNSDYPGNHGLLYHQVSPGHFEAVPLAQGIDHHRSHGIAVADFDRDGDLDVVVGHSFARCAPDPTDDSPCYASQQVRFFENTAVSGNYVQLTLTGGPTTNRLAVGARVSVKAGDVTQTQEVGGGHGHYGIQDDLTLHFGLGTECEAEVTVRWPNAALTTETFKLPAGYRFTWTEGEVPKAVM
jgi:hypothetical protein